MKDYPENYFLEACKEGFGDDENPREPEGWEDGDESDEATLEACQNFWNAPITEAEKFCKFIEPTKAPGTVDETDIDHKTEKDAYANDPAKDKGLDDFMEKDTGTATVELESDFFDFDLDLF